MLQGLLARLILQGELSGFVDIELAPTPAQNNNNNNKSVNSLKKPKGEKPTGKEDILVLGLPFLKW